MPCRAGEQDAETPPQRDVEDAVPYYDTIHRTEFLLMAIIIKNADEIEKMRQSGRLTGQVLELVGTMIKPGVTTAQLDKAASDFILSHGAKSSSKGYRGFPKSICVSVNEEVIHGIPGIKALKEGDIVSVDVSVCLNGFHGDAARTFPVGTISEEAQRLVDVTKQSFFEGIKFAYEECHLHQISAAIQNHVEQNGFSVVRDFCGHGIGHDLHESPEIPNYRPPSRGPKLIRGMTLAIEPMVNVGTHEIFVLKDQWTVVTRDKKLSAHYENTVLITDGEPELLTYYEGHTDS